MPMDYDDNDFQSQNLHLVGEGSSTVSPALRSYPLPKFEFDDNLHGHLRFDSLVENEVFLGITSQEDNHWIEEYSRGSSGIEFTSSAAESRRNNVWSEATSSESVEMLLKSVGQEERVAREAIDEPGSLATIMDPDLKQDGVVPNELPENFSGFNPSTSQSLEAQISAGELDSAIDNNCNLSVPEKKVDTICYDENQEVEKLRNDLSNNEANDLPKNSSSNEAEYNITNKETDMDDPKVLVSRESNLSSPSNAQSHSIEETKNAIAGDRQLDFIKVSAGNDLSEMGEGNVLNENVLASSNTHSGDLTDKDQSPSAKISGSMLVNDEKRSSEQDAICMDQDVTFNERGDTNLPSACSDMDIEVIGKFDSQKNVESSSSAEGCKEIIAPAQGSEADMTVLAEPVAAVESDTTYTLDGVHLLSESVATDDGATKSPTLGVSSMHDDNEKRTEVGCLNEGSSKNATPQVTSMVDCSSEGPFSVADKGASPDHSGKVVHENIDAIMSEQASEVNPDGLGCSTALEMSPLPCNSSAKEDDNVENEGLLAPKELTTGHHAPQSLAVNISDEQPASIDAVRPSECDADHNKPEGDSSVLGELQFVSPSETSSIKLSQITKDTHEVAPKKAPLPEGIETVEGKGQSVSSNNSTKGDKNFTFQVNTSVGLGQIDKDLQSIRAVQPCNMNMEGSSIKSSCGLLNPEKSHDVFTSSPQTPSSGTMQVGAKNSERKTRRKSSGKESAKKGIRQKETTPRQSGRVEKSTPSATGHLIQFEELKPKENIDSSIMKSCSVLPVLTSNLPDLNNSSSIFQQPFTDNQQVQLRAQILVYGSLISGTTPEEPHMIAAFTQSDGGRKAWEAIWRSCLERVHSQKSQANNPDTPMQPRSDLKDISHRTPDSGIKHSPVTSVPSKVFSSPIGGSTNKATPSPVISSLTPLSSPLWNISTPSNVGFPSGGIPRTFLHDYRQSLSPLHPYQTQAAQNFAGHNLPWLSPGPFGGPWVASSPISTFNVGPHFSSEAVKLTAVKVSGDLGIKHTSSIPVVHSSGPTVFSEQSGQASSEPKSRKWKKVNTSVAVSQTQASVPSQALAAPAAPAPGALVPHLPLVPGTTVHGQIPVLTQKPTDSITAPVVSSLLASSTHDHPRYTHKKVENIVISETLSKIEDSKVQTLVKMVQPSSDSKNTKRKKVTTSPAINRTPVVAYLPPVSLIAQNQTDSVTAPVTSLFHTPAVFSASTHDYLRTGYQNIEKAVVAEETLSKVEESKQQAENAATIAANEVGHFEGVWSQLEQQKGSGVVNDEARLMSSAAAVAKMSAAASVAKMAAAAAKIASNVAEQARFMADEVLLSNRTESFDRSGMISHPNSIISAAREAARWRIEAASAASKHAENLDAIVKAAELAAEAVSQAGKIVGLGDPVALRKLVEADAPGYWKTSDQPGKVSGHLNSNSGEKNLEDAPNVSVKEIQTSNYGLSLQGHSGNLAENPMMVIDGISGSITGHEKDKRTPSAHKGPNSSKTVGVVPETDIGSHHNYVGQNVPQSASGAWEEHNIKEGCLVEVYKDDGKYTGAWFAANVLSFKDERALVCYTEIQSDEGSEKLKEWVSLEAEGMKVPRIRIAHPMTTMRFEGSRKRRRTAVTDYAWSNGDRVDVWMQDCWREGVVTEPNTIDITSLTVQFPAQGETSVVRSWHVRPTLIWKDGKWIEWSRLKRRHFTENDTPKEKRMKPGSPTMKDKPKDKPPTNIDIRLELPLSAEESSFNVGQISKDDKKINTLRTVRTGLQKDGPRVIFGVPKPGKKQKFMEVSKHYDGNDKNNKTNDSIKFTRYLKPQPPGPRGWKISSRNEEKQVAETKPRVKSRKPPVPSFRTLAQKDNNNNSSLSSKSMTREPEMMDKSDRDSVSDVENVSGHQNQMEFGSSSNTEVASRKTFRFTSNVKSERLNKGKQALAKDEAKDKSYPEVTEPRRSNRRIQPTSRLLEGLQSSLTISKIPSVSHGNQRSHNKVTSKGNTKHG